MMKKLLILLLLNSSAFANDLIFKQGFDGTVLIAGVASGINSQGLVLDLTVDNTPQGNLTITTDGSFVFESYVVSGNVFDVTIYTLPNSPSYQSCVLSQNSGTVSSSGVDTISIICNSTAWKWDEMSWKQGGWQ